MRYQEFLMKTLGDCEAGGSGRLTGGLSQVAEAFFFLNGPFLLLTYTL